MTLISEKYDQIDFLFNINTLENLQSIFLRGLLSKNLIKRLGISYFDLSDPNVQSTRDRVQIPHLRPLHDYANLYFNPRNPMLYRRIQDGYINEICIICVDKSVLDLPDTIVTDRNAAASLAVFDTPANMLKFLNFNRIFAEDWTIDPPLKKIVCAEVLVLKGIHPKYFKKIIVASPSVKMRVDRLNLGVEVTVNPHYFFR